MLETIRNAFKIKEIRTRLIFTLLMLVVVRIGSRTPAGRLDFLMRLLAVPSRTCQYSR